MNEKLRASTNRKNSINKSSLAIQLICSVAVLCILTLLASCSTESLRSITLSPSDAQTVAAGQTIQLKAMGAYIQGSHPATTIDITGGSTWTSSTTAVATINSAGLVTAVSAGTTTITVTANGQKGAVSASTSVTVTGSAPAPVHELTSITIIPNTQTVTASGETIQFTAIGNYSNGAPTTQDLTKQPNTWSSSDKQVATIDPASGLATAKGVGTTTITATGKSASGAIVIGSATITVTLSSASGLTSVSITPNTQSVAVGQSVSFTAIGSYTNATPATQDLTKQSNWASSASQVATIDSASGLATAKGVGTTTIIATPKDSNGTVVIGTATLTVSAAPPTGLTSITLTPNSQTVSIAGETVRFVAIGNYAGVTPATQDLTTKAGWDSSDRQVATIDPSNGVVTAAGVGTTTITAKAPSADGSVIVGTATVTVTSSTSPGLINIRIIPTSQTVFTEHETAQYIAIGTFSGVTPSVQDITKSVTWVSSDVKVATIDAISGLATENSIGTTAITAIAKRADGTVVTGAATFTAAGSADVPIGPTILPTLSVFKVGNGAGSGNVTSSSPPIVCKPDNTCTGSYPVGTVVTLTASPDNFGGWSSTCQPVPNEPLKCIVTMNDNVPVGAIFN